MLLDLKMWTLLRENWCKLWSSRCVSFQINPAFYKIWDFYRAEDLNCRPLVYNNVFSGRWFSMCRRKTLPPSSGCKVDPENLRQQVHVQRRKPPTIIFGVESHETTKQALIFPYSSTQTFSVLKHSNFDPLIRQWNQNERKQNVMLLHKHMNWIFILPRNKYIFTTV